MQEYIIEVDLSEIKVSPFQPRIEFSLQELEELSASIKAVGLIHPPVVRKILQGDKFLYYELIAGERRCRAAKMAGFEKIKVIVRDYLDDEAAKATLIENVQRVDLNPLEMAESFLKLIEVFRMTQEDVAEKVGKKRSTVANYLRLLSLPVPIRQSLSSGSITMGHAKAILSLDSFELKEKLHSLIVAQELTVREAEKESQKLARGAKTKKESKRQANVHITDLEEKLTHHFGTKVTLEPIKKAGGRVCINYYSLDDLDRLLTVFGIS